MAQDLRSIQNAIRDANHPWQAGTTSVSDLSNDQQDARLGLRVTEAELQATARAIHAADELGQLRAISYPPAADWRSNGGDWTTHIRNQGQCGSCVAFGTAATLEARIKIACKNVGMQPDLSEAYLFYCGCGACCQTGWNFQPALDFAKNTGIAQETDFPYIDSNQPCKSGLTPYIKIQAWRQILAASDRRDVLATRGPVVGGMAVYRDFFAYTGGINKRTSGSELAGYHAISVVGYNEEAKCWICKNSWGTSWGEAGPSGERGWFRIAYGECGLDTQFAFYDVDLTCPAPSGCERFVPYLVRVIQAARVNQALRNCLLYHVCGVKPGPRRPVCSPAIMAVVARVRSILMQCPQYRASFCRGLMTS